MTSNYIYKNADSSSQVRPKSTFFPESLEEIIQIIKNNPGRKIRASSSIHTFNTISICDDIIIRLSKLNKILSVNKNTKIVSVEGGILLHSLVEQLEEHKLGLQVLSSCTWQSLAGALSTSTHGSRINRGSLSSQIVSMTMVLHDGKVVTFRKGDVEFPAATVSLGALGVIYSVELLCEDLYYVKEKKINTSWKKFMNNIDVILDNCEYTQLTVDPATQQCQIYLRKQVKIKDMANVEKESVYFRVTSKLEEQPAFSEMELTIPLNKLDVAMNDVFKLLEKEKLGSPLLVRFIGINEDSLIGMTSDREKNVSISIFGDAAESTSLGLLNLMRQFENTLVEHQGRPHYGKKNFINNKDMVRLYPRLGDFVRVRNKLDPGKVFTNEYVSNLLDR